MKVETMLRYIIGVYLILFLITFFLTTGCSSVQGPLDTSLIYKNDISMTVNNKEFKGVGVVSRSTSYNLLIESEDKMDLLTISSCHRDVTIENAKKSYSYTYTPNELESTGSCTLRIGGYSKNSGKHSWGILDFEGSEEMLPARIQCNGLSEVYLKGVSVCQSHDGLIQKIIFDRPVEIAQKSLPEKCKPQTEDNKTWTYYMPKGECTINFFESGGKLVHRHTTLGYASYILREQ